MKAFPTTKPLEGWGDPNQGMDLRDYFAAKALQGYISYMSPNPNGTGTICDDMKAPTNTEAIAKSAYLFADAMMEARKQC